MKTRILGLLAVAATAIALTSSPASAQAGAVSYAASSDARALFISLFGEDNSLTLATSHAEIASTPAATGTGVGLVSPVQRVSEVSGTVTSDGASNGSTDETCSPLSLPEVPVLAAETACASGFAEIAGGDPAASSTARVATLGVAPDDILGETPLGEALGEELVDPVLEGLAPLFDGINENSGLDAESTLRDLFNAILGPDAGELVGATVGASAADAGIVDGNVLATSSASGTTIDILDRGELLGPVLSIVVGDATSTVNVNLTDAKASGTFEPALVRVIIANDILDNLPEELVNALPLEGDDANEIVVPVGQTICLAEGTPIESCITAANGEVIENEDGSVTVNTSAVRLDLLKGVEGGIVLALADTSATGGAVIETEETTTTTTLAPEEELPRTGADLPLGTAATASVFALATLGLALTTRARRTTT